ncbi:MAG: MoxR family ATPase [Halofilum sp. (in: g-proteobacteria)]
MNPSSQPAVATPPRLEAAAQACSRIILGKDHVVRLALACLLARGHLLIEDTPGVGKTTLAHTLAQVLHLDYRRIQFTSDLLPADVLGTSVFERESGVFRFHPGPVFTELLLADEINRAPPKTQSALLEAMEEQQVTTEGETRALGQPFFVIATQNPREQAGTFPLPESQLDRFLMRLSLGYPGHSAERELLAGSDRRRLIEDLDPVLSPQQLLDLQAAVDRVHASAALLDYIQALLAASRTGTRFVAGLSPRAGVGLLSAARAWALLDGRDYALPEDVQAVLGPVVDHRLQTTDGATQQTPGEQLRSAVAVP